jgi:hypothetical protein
MDSRHDEQRQQNTTRAELCSIDDGEGHNRERSVAAKSVAPARLAVALVARDDDPYSNVPCTD